MEAVVSTAMNPSPLLQEALQVFEQRRMKEAKELFQQVLKLTPQMWMIHSYLGYIAEEEKELEEALKHYQALLEFKQSYEIHYNLGVVYRKM